MSHWQKVAQTWARIGPPLRPSPEDTAIVTMAISARPVDVLVLGVTPELVSLDLYAGSTLTAVEKEQGMIDTLFQPADGRRAIVADWRDMPLPDASIDVAVGDGCVTMFAFPDETRRFFESLARVVRPGGQVILRLFASPDYPTHLDSIVAEVSSLTSPDALRMLIAMAIVDEHRGAKVSEIYETFNRLFPDRDALATQTGWPRERIDHVDTYKDSTARWSFPTVDEIRGLLAGSFMPLALRIPGYHLGERCPTLLLRRV